MSTSPESPAEYIALLEAQNKTLRAELLKEVGRRLEYEDALARLARDHVQLKRDTGRAPHDYEPARPGLSEVD